MKAQKKPVVIDFLPMHEIEINLDEIKNWIAEFGDNFDTYFEFVPNGQLGDLLVKTLEGNSYAITTQDVIIRGVKGEYYPCKKDVFEETYEVL